MKKFVSVGVVDYGMGNLHSVSKALSENGAQVVISDQRSKLKSNNLLVLPGVGSFGAAMKNLARKSLDDFICQWISSGRAYFGICLGLQLLFEKSEESPSIKGLGVLKGGVQKFRPSDFKKGSYQVPHMGWNTSMRRKREGDYLFKGIDSNDYFYFVHTYYPNPFDKRVVMTETTYGRSFCSGIYRDNVFATQFHPEKSGRVGLLLLSNVIRNADVLGRH